MKPETWFICKCGAEVRHADENTFCKDCKRIGCFTLEERERQ